jgi:hypothetical protein
VRVISQDEQVVVAVDVVGLVQDQMVQMLLATMVALVAMAD